MEIILDNKAIIIIILHRLGIVLDNKAIIIIILHHLGINGTIILKITSIININSNFVKINVVIVLKTKCIVMEEILNGCIKIAKELAESAMEDSSSTVQLLLIANGLHGQSTDIAQALVEVELKFLQEHK